MAMMEMVWVSHCCRKNKAKESWSTMRPKRVKPYRSQDSEGVIELVRYKRPVKQSRERMWGAPGLWDVAV